MSEAQNPPIPAELLGVLPSQPPSQPRLADLIDPILGNAKGAMRVYARYWLNEFGDLPISEIQPLLGAWERARAEQVKPETIRGERWALSKIFEAAGLELARPKRQRARTLVERRPCEPEPQSGPSRNGVNEERKSRRRPKGSRVCPGCRTEITGKPGGRIYCSVACRDQTKIERVRALEPVAHSAHAEDPTEVAPAGSPRGIFERPPGSGVWWIRFCCDGKEHRRKIGSRESAIEAYRLAKEGLFEVAHELQACPGRPVLLSTAIVRYLETAGDVTPCYVTFAQEWARLWGDRRLTEITTGDLRAWQSELVQAGRLAAQTINMKRQVLVNILNLAVQDKRLRINPARELKRLKVKNGRTRFLTLDEEKRFLAELDPSEDPVDRELAAFVRFLLNTGVRAGEALGIEWEHVQDGTVWIAAQKTCRDRTLPLNETARAVLESRRGEPKPFGQKYSALAGRFNKLRNRLGLSDVSFHVLRHTAATRMTQRGASPFHVQRVLGHSNVAMTQRYTHLRMDDLAAALDRLAPSPVGQAPIPSPEIEDLRRGLGEVQDLLRQLVAQGGPVSPTREAEEAPRNPSAHREAPEPPAVASTPQRPAQDDQRQAGEGQPGELLELNTPRQAAEVLERSSGSRPFEIHWPRCSCTQCAPQTATAPVAPESTSTLCCNTTVQPGAPGAPPPQPAEVGFAGPYPYGTFPGEQALADWILSLHDNGHAFPVILEELDRCGYQNRNGRRFSLATVKAIVLRGRARRGLPELPPLPPQPAVLSSWEVPYGRLPGEDLVVEWILRAEAARLEPEEIAEALRPLASRFSAAFTAQHIRRILDQARWARTGGL